MWWPMAEHTEWARCIGTGVCLRVDLSPGPVDSVCDIQGSKGWYQVVGGWSAASTLCVALAGSKSSQGAGGKNLYDIEIALRLGAGELERSPSRK